MLRPVDARGWSCESYSERVALLELLEAKCTSRRKLARSGVHAPAPFRAVRSVPFCIRKLQDRSEEGQNDFSKPWNNHFVRRWPGSSSFGLNTEASASGQRQRPE